MNKIIILSSILMLAACGSTPAPTPTPATHASVAPVVASETRDSSQSIGSIKDVQTRLTSLNFYHGKVDGIWGAATQQAVLDFQQANKLDVTGKLNDATMTALHSDKPVAAPTN